MAPLPAPSQLWTFFLKKKHQNQAQQWTYAVAELKNSDNQQKEKKERKKNRMWDM